MYSLLEVKPIEQQPGETSMKMSEVRPFASLEEALTSLKRDLKHKEGPHDEEMYNPELEGSCSVAAQDDRTKSSRLLGASQAD